MRGGRGGGRGGRSDDIGNRVVSPRGPLPANDDVGNMIAPEDRHLPSEDIGNRLRPGERSPYPKFGAPTQPVYPDDDDDSAGNR